MLLEFELQRSAHISVFRSEAKNITLTEILECSLSLTRK
jgi:hypothetical protein